MEDKSTIMRALQSTGDTIVEELESKGLPAGELIEQLPRLQTRWDALREKLDLRVQNYEVSANRFISFLTSFTGFFVWLTETHSMMVDEFCVQIPAKASEDTIAHHRARLQVGHRVNLLMCFCFCVCLFVCQCVLN